jgi:ribosomal protein S18 acetylase RimI-like enzyme
MVDLREESIADLREHAGIPSVFETWSVYDVCAPSASPRLVERALSVPLRKNYDQFEDPVTWSRALGTTESVLIAAFSKGQCVGGIIAAVAVPGLVEWSKEPGVSVLWDLRVAPAFRLRAAEAWAWRCSNRQLDVETQNTNVVASQFYMHNGFVLREARRGAYAQLPEEVQLIWRKQRDG